MHMSRSENAIRLQLKSCLSSALTLVFFSPNTTEHSIQWSFREGTKKKKGGRGIIKKIAGLGLILYTKVLRETGI